MSIFLSKYSRNTTQGLAKAPRAFSPRTFSIFKHIHAHSGLTLIEFLVTFAILAILAGISFAAFTNMRDYQALRIAATDVHSALVDARGDTLASRGDTVHGLHIEEAQAVRFAGATYDSEDPENVAYPFYGAVRATTSPPISDIVFTRLSGESSASGTIILIDARTGASSTVRVHHSGLIEF